MSAIDIVIPPGTKINSDLTVLKLINSGAYAKVYKVSYKGNVKALRIPLSVEEYKNYGMESVIDLDILTRIKHPNIMYAEELIHNPKWGGISVIMPYGIRNLYDANLMLTLQERYTVAFKIITAVKHLLDNNILYLDIKPNNILFVENGGDITPMLADFNMVARMDHPQKSILVRKAVIAMAYRPYEIYCDNRMMGEHTLVWQLGALLIFIFGKSIIPGETELEIKKYIEQFLIGKEQPTQIIYSLRYWLKTEIKNEEQLELGITLLCGMLDTEVKNRFTLDMVLKHPFWQNLSKVDRGETKESSKEFSKDLTGLYSTVKGSKLSSPKQLCKKDSSEGLDKLCSNTEGLTFSEGEHKFISCTNSIRRVHDMFLLHPYLKKSDFIPSGIFFEAIDLVHRTIHLVSGKPFKNFIIHNITCTVLAWKMYFYRLEWYMLAPNGTDIKENFITNNFYAKKYQVTLEEIFNMEINIIMALKGKLYRPFIYDGTAGLSLPKVLDNLLLAKETYLPCSNPGFADVTDKENINLLLKGRILFSDMVGEID
jgi:serine/threonine protein kinase